MGIKKYGPYTPSRRQMSGYDFAEITKDAPEKSLVVSLKKNAGRNNQGKITVRHRGGGSRRKYRIIDFKRNEKGQKNSGYCAGRINKYIRKCSISSGDVILMPLVCTGIQKRNYFRK